MAKSPFTIAGRQRDARGGRRHRRHQSARGPDGIGGGGTGLIRPRHRSALGGRLPPRLGARRTISPAKKESPRTIQKRSGMERRQWSGNRPRGQAAERRSGPQHHRTVAVELRHAVGGDRPGEDLSLPHVGLITARGMPRSGCAIAEYTPGPLGHPSGARGDGSLLPRRVLNRPGRFPVWQSGSLDQVRW
jgi:hypothetical protein